MSLREAVSFLFAKKENATGIAVGWSYPARKMASVSAADDLTDVERVLAGDISAFEGIVRRWQGPLINMAYRFCNDRGRAEEMAQEAFLRTYRSLASWRKDAAFSTWLFAVAANLYRSELKRMPLQNVALDDIAELTDKRSSHADFEMEDRDRAVRKAVLALPAKYRDAMVLYYFHEMDVPAAAKSLCLPEGTVKARLFRGREILRGKLPQLLEAPRLKEA
jgi:RNA polymerase sigma-70 factor (ECF subfamily)